MRECKFRCRKQTNDFKCDGLYLSVQKRDSAIVNSRISALLANIISRTHNRCSCWCKSAASAEYLETATSSWYAEREFLGSLAPASKLGLYTRRELVIQKLTWTEELMPPQSIVVCSDHSP